MVERVIETMKPLQLHEGNSLTLSCATWVTQRGHRGSYCWSFGAGGAQVFSYLVRVAGYFAGQVFWSRARKAARMEGGRLKRLW